MKNYQIKAVLRIKDLEIFLGVSKSTIWRWRQQPEICFPEPIWMGSRMIGWKIEDIEIWINNNMKKGVAA